MFFDWAQQPYATLGLTFIFGPYFASVAAARFLAEGMDPATADAQAQSLWTGGQTIAGLIIALTAPFIGAFVDASGRKLPWVAAFTLVFTLCAWSMWWLTPDGAWLYPVLVLFVIGFVAAESGVNITNALLPGLGTPESVGRISGSGAAFGYWGGVLALFLMLALLAENAAGVTLLGNPPILGLDPAAREGTRSVGPFIALWNLLFIIPFFLWVRDSGKPPAQRPTLGAVTAELRGRLRMILQRRSLGAFLLGSMLYRDALNGIYAIGGVYAALVLDWSVVQVGVFGIVGAITAAIVTWAGGRADARFGPKPVILLSIWTLILVSVVIVGMSRAAFFGVPLPEGSALPDIMFYVCGALIGGAGGSIYSASRTMMIRHSTPDHAGEAFGLFALSGKATAFLAPLLVSVATWATGSVQLGASPVILLFLCGLFLLRYVNSEGDSRPWSAHLPQSR